MTSEKLKKRWAWVLTGSGHFFNETIELINMLEKVDLFVSKAAEEVLVMYKKKGKISETASARASPFCIFIWEEDIILHALACTNFPRP